MYVYIYIYIPSTRAAPSRSSCKSVNPTPPKRERRLEYNYLARICSGSEEGSYSRLTCCCITQR